MLAFASLNMYCLKGLIYQVIPSGSVVAMLSTLFTHLPIFVSSTNDYQW